MFGRVGSTVQASTSAPSCVTRSTRLMPAAEPGENEIGVQIVDARARAEPQRLVGERCECFLVRGGFALVQRKRIEADGDLRRAGADARVDVGIRRADDEGRREIAERPRAGGASIAASKPAAGTLKSSCTCRS